MKIILMMPGRRRESARRWPVTDAVVPMLGQRWAGRRRGLGGDG